MKLLPYSILLIIVLMSCRKEDDISDNGAYIDLYVSEENVSLNNHNQNAAFYIQNNLDAEFELVLSYDTSLLHLSNNSLYFKRYMKSEFEIKLKLHALAQDSLSTKIYISKLNQIIDTISVIIHNYSFNTHYFANVILDAEYSKVLDKLVFISESPYNALYTFDFNAAEWDSITFESKPLCLGVSTNKTSGVIGFEDKVYLLDLDNLEILHEYSINEKSFDILISTTDWIYVFPDPAGSNTDIFYSINTQEDIVYELDYIWSVAPTRVRMHPEEEYIYGAWTPQGSSQITYKFKIVEGPIELPYQNEKKYNHGHNIWLSHNGSNLYGRNGNVFSTSNESELNLTLIGELENIENILCLEHNPITNIIYAINSFKKNWSDDYFSTELLCYDASDFNLIKKINVNIFSRLNTDGEVELIDPDLKYVFFDNNYSNYYTISRAPEGAGITVDWSIQKTPL